MKGRDTRATLDHGVEIARGGLQKSGHRLLGVGGQYSQQILGGSLEDGLFRGFALVAVLEVLDVLVLEAGGAQYHLLHVVAVLRGLLPFGEAIEDSDPGSEFLALGVASDRL
jgi:hypothetical protein